MWGKNPADVQQAEEGPGRLRGPNQALGNDAHTTPSHAFASNDGLRKLAGKFIVLEGPDGAGKTTQLAVLADLLRDNGLLVETVRDPGGTALGERIRGLLLHPPDRGAPPAPYCELLLFMASRTQLVAEVIAPCVRQGKTVLCDRFIWSTLAYQAANGSNVDEILSLGRRAIGDCWPDLTIILDVPPEVGMARIAHGRGRKADAIEERSLAYRSQVREFFLAMPSRYGHAMAVLDGTGDFDHVHASIVNVLISAEFSPA